jgi:hypothetical protein
VMICPLQEPPQRTVAGRLSVPETAPRTLENGRIIRDQHS